MLPVCMFVCICICSAGHNSGTPGPAMIYTRAAITAFLTWWGNGGFDDLHPYPGGSAAFYHISR